MSTYCEKAYGASVTLQVPEARSGSMLDREDDDAAFDAKKVVVAWFGDDISDLIASLAAFAPRGSSVSVVSKEQPKVNPITYFPWVLLQSECQRKSRCCTRSRTVRQRMLILKC